ncbi:MAG: hypothetical protein KatS3mg065_0143 [Chloroflexota bacterium]|nr:MAG: hypothetical protein KatS3mg065_0143 [Chloroflexota bacterium]
MRPSLGPSPPPSTPPGAQHFGPRRRLIGVRSQVIPIARSVLVRLGLIGLVFLLVEIVLPDLLAAVAH